MNDYYERHSEKKMAILGADHRLRQSRGTWAIPPAYFMNGFVGAIGAVVFLFGMVHYQGKPLKDFQKMAEQMAVQSEKIQNLEGALRELRSNQDRSWDEIDEAMSSIGHQSTQNSQELSSLTVDDDLLRLEVKELKETNEQLVEHFIELSQEIQPSIK